MYHQTKHSLLSCNFFKIMYDYKSIFDICIKNNAMKEEVSAAKNTLKCCKMYKTYWCNDDKTWLMFKQSTIIKNISLSSLIILSAKNLKQKKLSKKLLNKMLKFFCIQEFINKQMYHLSLLIIYKTHFIFHVFLLKSYNCRLNNDFILKYFAFKLIDDKQEWKVEKILQKWKRKKILYYKIQWKEYFMKYNQWFFFSSSFTCLCSLRLWNMMLFI